MILDIIYMTAIIILPAFMVYNLWDASRIRRDIDDINLKKYDLLLRHFKSMHGRILRLERSMSGAEKKSMAKTRKRSMNERSTRE